MFELVLAMWCLFASWRWGDWKNIEKYYPTFLYVTVGSLMYEVIALSHFHLWKLNVNYHFISAQNAHFFAHSFRKPSPLF